MIRCKFYARGNCRNGDACPFSHVLQSENADVQQFDKIIGTQSERLRRPIGQGSFRSHGFNEYSQPSSQHPDKNRYKWVSPLLKERETKMIQNKNGVDKVVPDNKPVVKPMSWKEATIADLFADNKSADRALYKTKSERPSSAPLENNELLGNDCCNQIGQLYSKMEDLTDEQIKQFEADEFEYGKVPTIPPPKEYCF